LNNNKIASFEVVEAPNKVAVSVSSITPAFLSELKLKASIDHLVPSDAELSFLQEYKNVRDIKALKKNRENLLFNMMVCIEI
jgi:hypothetical protein